MPKRTADPSAAVDLTFRVTVGVPVIRRPAGSGADSNRAFCPGKSSESPAPNAASWPPMPGSADRAGGVAPAGLAKVCSRPVSAIGCGPEVSPGYRSPVAPRSWTSPSVESMPPERETRNAGPVAAFSSPLR
ncbi:hypothetical protein GCM10020254_12910 [Streptomyces goshikiensis]